MRLLFIAATLVLCGCGQRASAADSAAPKVLAGPWEYRWGDSPKDADGHFVWASPNQPPWSSSGSNVQPPGRNGSQHLWMRTTLPAELVPSPTLYFLIVEQLFEAYVDGQLIYRFGELDGRGPSARRFLGNRTHMIPLPPDYLGRQLVLRIYSHHTRIGISGQVRLGSVAAIFTTMVREDTGYAISGVILCALGIIAVLLFLIQRTDGGYLYYGCFALGMGIWILCQMQSRSYLIDAPLAWVTVEIFALYAAVAFFLRFVLQIFGRGPFGLTSVITYIVCSYVIAAAIAVFLLRVPLLATLTPFHLIMLGGIVYVLILMASLSISGHQEARLFAVGFLVAALFAAHDTLAVLGVLPRSQLSFSQFGQGLFVLCLGLILARRFQRVHLKLAQAQKDLSEKVASLEERNVEIQQLNDDLHRQIEARSKDLANAILDASSSFSELEVQVLGAGFLIADRYRVIRLIGQGGMGAVYEVERVTDGRHLAAKVLSVQAGKRGLARFAREAQLLAKLKHPNLVNIQDVDMTQSHMAYIVMELVSGQNLAALSTNYGNLVFGKRVLGQISSALASVHTQGIVHRDLKPENVLIQYPDDLERVTAKLVDFGVSMIVDEQAGATANENPVSMPTPISSEDIPNTAFQTTLTDSAEAAAMARASDAGKSQRVSENKDRIYGRPADLTQTGVIMGTPLYMAPELRLGAKFARPSSDMFSFGVMAYEVFSGQLPSDQPALFQVFSPNKSWFPKLLSKCPDLPEPIADIIERCLDPQPDRRPTAAEVQVVLSAN